MTHISVWHGCHDDIRRIRVRAPRMRSRDTMSAASSLDSAGLPAEDGRKAAARRQPRFETRRCFPVAAGCPPAAA